MELQFYAVKEDIDPVLEFVFVSGFAVYESASRFDKEVRQFSSPQEIWNVYDDTSEQAQGPWLYLRLYHPQMAGNVLFTRTELIPGSVPNATFRYSVKGWGLFDLQLGGITDDKLITPSRFARNTEKRVLNRQSTYQYRLGTADEWDWRAIEKLSHSIEKKIKGKPGAPRVNSRLLLPGAQRLSQDEGLELALN